MTCKSRDSRRVLLKEGTGYSGACVTKAVRKRPKL